MFLMACQVEVSSSIKSYSCSYSAQHNVWLQWVDSSVDCFFVVVVVFPTIINCGHYRRIPSQHTAYPMRKCVHVPFSTLMCAFSTLAETIINALTWPCPSFQFIGTWTLSFILHLSSNAGAAVSVKPITCCLTPSLQVHSKNALGRAKSTLCSQRIRAL